jgi:hypothetical protein
MIWELLAGVEEGKGVAYLDDLVAREFELRNVGGVAGHEVAVENAQDRLVGYYQQVVLFAFQLEDDGFHADSKVVI